MKVLVNGRYVSMLWRKNLTRIESKQCNVDILPIYVLELYCMICNSEYNK